MRPKASTVFQGGGARRRIGHVQLQSQRAFAVTGGDRLQRRRAAGGEHHVVALGQHGLSQSPPKPEDAPVINRVLFISRFLVIVERYS